MDVRKLLTVLIVSVLVTMATPVVLGDGSCGAESGDVVINVDGSGSTIVMDMDSGSTESTTIYVTNSSDNYLSLDVPV